MKGFLFESVNFILILQLVIRCDYCVQAEPVQYEPPYNSHYIVNSPIKVVPFYNQVSSPQFQQQSSLVEKNVRPSPYLMYSNIGSLFLPSNVLPYSQQHQQQQQISGRGYQSGLQQFQQQNPYNVNYRGNNLHHVNPSIINNQFQQVSQVRGAVPLTYQNQNQNIQYQNQYSTVSPIAYQAQRPSSYSPLSAPVQPNFVQPYTNGFFQGTTSQPLVGIGGFDDNFDFNNYYGHNNDDFQFSAATYSGSPSNFGYQVSGPGVISQYQFNRPSPSDPPSSQFGFSSSAPTSSGPSSSSGPQSVSSNSATILEQFQALDKTQEFQDFINANILRQNTDIGYSSSVADATTPATASPTKNMKSSKSAATSSSKIQNNYQSGSSRTTSTSPATTTTKRPKTTVKPTSASTTSSSEPKLKFGQRLSPIKSIRNQNKNSITSKNYLPPTTQN